MSDRSPKCSPTIFAASRNATFSPGSADGPVQLDLLDGLTIDRSGQEAARASRSRSLAKEAVTTTRGICGPTSFASSVPPGPLSSWENRLRDRLATVGSTELSLIWREKTTPGGASMSRLAPWTPPISAAASTGSPWPTPTVSWGTGGQTSRSGDRTGELLIGGLVRGAWPTPHANCHTGPGEHGRGGQNIQTVATWITPTTRDWKDTPGMATTGAGGRVRLDQLPRQVAVIAPSGPTPSGSPGLTEKRGVLNPAFVCWLMGFPPAWDACAPTETRSSRSSRRK